MRVPAMATEEPMMEPVDMGVLKAMTDATMMTTRLMVLPTAWVTGLTCGVFDGADMMGIM